MKYMGEFNLLKWTGKDFKQIPTGLKETGLEAEDIMAIIRETIIADEIKQLNDMESLSTSFPLTKKTAKEVMTKITKEAADEGMSFLVDTLIESTLDIDMGTDNSLKDSVLGELFKLAMDEEERSYIASIGKYEKNQLFFESVVPTSKIIQSLFNTEYEADFFVAHVALNTYELEGTFDLSELERKVTSEKKQTNFCFKGINYPFELNKQNLLMYNPFTMFLDLHKK